MGVDSLAMEREPRLRLAANVSPRAARASHTADPSAAARASRSTLTLAAREVRLRQRIDSIAHRLDAKERRILWLEDRLRLAAVDPSEREIVLEARLKHMNRRVIALHEELREARNVA